MAITGIVQLSGRIRFVPPAPNVDSSSNAAQLSDVLESMPCSGQESGTYTLVADGDTPVSLGSLAGADLVVLKVVPNVGIPPSPGFPNGVPATPNPVVVKLTSSAGAAQAFPLTSFLYLPGGPFTAISLARAPGVQTMVRVQLFALGS